MKTNETPRRKQRGIVSGITLFFSPQAAGNLPLEIKRTLLVALFGAIGVFSQSVWDGTADIAWYNSNATKDTLYISNGRELAGMAQLVNNAITDFSGKKIILTNDIDLGNKNWVPIGNNSTTKRSFTGIFDGCGKTIFNLSVSDFQCAGLFGYVGTDGQIKNLTVNVKEIKTTNSLAIGYAGGLAGYYASTKTIENCGVNIADSISASSSLYSSSSGGLVGYGSAAITISNSYTTGNVSTSSSSSSYPSYSGGLVGYGSAAITISNSYTTGNVSASSSSSYPYSGGLVGYANSSSNITNCYASGTITATGKGTKYIGGIFGQWSSGTNTSVYYNSAGASQAAGSGSPTGITGKTFAELKNISTFQNWDFANVWGINAVKNNGLPYLYPRWSSMADVDWYNPSAQAYNITTAEQLAGLAKLVNDGTDFEGKTITLGADIFLKNTADEKILWTPIGYYPSRPFKGEFDGISGGQNRKIYGMYVKGDDYPERNGVGLFGYATGIIRNFDVLDGEINAENQDYVGAVVGYGATLSNVNSNVTVTGGNYVGGLAGYASLVSRSSFNGKVNGKNKVGGLAGESSVSNSYSECDVSGVFEVGGLTGVLGDGKTNSISGSYSKSNVVGDDNVGGLVGTLGFKFDATIESSYASGNVSGNESQASAGNDNIGGLVGYFYNGSISKSFASGNVKGTTKVGGLAGRIDKGTIEYAYSRGSVSAIKLNNAGSVYAGGLIGQVGSNFGDNVNIKQAYSSGAVSADTYPGGFIGASSFGTLNLDGCYFDMTASRQSKGIGMVETGNPAVAQKSSQEMKQQNTYVNWDFANVWGTSSGANNGYPYLLWSHSSQNNTPICEAKKSNHKHGILLEKSVVSQVARINVKTPEQAQINLAIYDNTGNVVFKASGRNTDTFVWNLTNLAGRTVANGSYLVVAEAKGAKGTYAYSAKVGVKR